MSTPAKLRPNRSAGILLHPSSLPGPYGIGDLGPPAFAWVDRLRRHGQTWWQILPLGPTGYGDSPYQCFSAFAGNPYLVSPELLLRESLLQPDHVSGMNFPVDRVDYGAVIPFKLRLIATAWERFRGGAGAALRPAFEGFRVQQASWLEDYALFMALKETHGGVSWHDWPEPYRLRQADALDSARRDLRDAIDRFQFGQFLFFRQWSDLKRYANDKGLRLIGDVPIFVSSDSADLWANPHLFVLDQTRRPTAVAGVPPDYFSATGQLWGNPLYHWEAAKKTGYAWWVARMRGALAQVDLVRLDHFRGFEAYWEIPAGSPTAQVGRWVPGPGADLFATLKEALGGLPLIAEDLGVITPEVRWLREHLDLPGMRILQFAFGDDSTNPYLPHNFDPNTVVYTGTHDNDTTSGWYASANDREKGLLHRYAGVDANDVAGGLIRQAWASVADYAIAPLQDVLRLGTRARMNFPGKPAGNWTWRFTDGMLDGPRLDQLGEWTEIYGRKSGA